jgi:hypothetical protein
MTLIRYDVSLRFEPSHFHNIWISDKRKVKSICTWKVRGWKTWATEPEITAHGQLKVTEIEDGEWMLGSSVIEISNARAGNGNVMSKRIARLHGELNNLLTCVCGRCIDRLSSVPNFPQLWTLCSRCYICSSIATGNVWCIHIYQKERSIKKNR